MYNDIHEHFLRSLCPKDISISLIHEWGSVVSQFLAPHKILFQINLLSLVVSL